MWTIYIEGVQSPTAATFIMFYRYSLHPFLLRKSSLHAVIRKMGHAVLSYMARLIAPCTRTHPWVRDVTIRAPSPRTPSQNRTSPNILGFTIGFFSTISKVMMRIPANITGRIHTLLLKDLSQVCLSDLLQSRQRPTSRSLIINLQWFKLSLRFRRCSRSSPR